MNRQLLSILAGIAVAPLIVQYAAAQQPSPRFFPTVRQSIVLIQAGRERKGTGFIVAKDGSVYYALTAGHVVQNGQFQVQTDATVQEGGETLTVESVLPLPGADLALIQFTSTREYPVAKLARDATRVVEIDRVFILGYLGNGTGGPEIPSGGVTSRQPLTAGSGTAIFHDVNTVGGMSGSPVLTENGEVVGVHIGLRDESGGIREAIPIEKYWELAPQVFTREGRDALANSRFPQAIASLQSVRRIFNQDTPEASLILAYAYFGLNDVGRAREEARKISATNANAAVLLGAIDYIEGNSRAAIENATSAAGLDERTLGGYALSIAGLSHIAIAGDNSNRDARLSINRATSLIRDDAFVYLASSCLQFKVEGNVPRATADFNNANRLISQRPGDPFLAVLTTQLQARARTCLPEDFGSLGIPTPTNLGRYKSSEPISFGTSVTALAVSNDSRFVAVGLNNGRVVIYNLETKGEVASFNLSQSNSPISSIAFSPNGRDIAFASGTGQLRVINIQSGGEKYSNGDVGNFPQVVFSNNNNFLFVGSITNTLRMLDNRDGTPRNFRTDAHPGGITSLTLSPDGRLVSGGADGRIRFWNPNDLTASDNNYQAHQGAVTSIAFNREGSQIISAGVDKLIRACNWQNGECTDVARTNEPIGGLSVASNGQVAYSERPFLVTPENRIFLQDLSSGGVLGNLPDHRNRVVSLAYTPDGRYLISGSADQTIIIWEVQ